MWGKCLYKPVSNKCQLCELTTPSDKRRQTTFSPRNLKNSVLGPRDFSLCSLAVPGALPPQGLCAVLWTSHTLNVLSLLPFPAAVLSVRSVMG